MTGNAFFIGFLNFASMNGTCGFYPVSLLFLTSNAV